MNSEKDKLREAIGWFQEHLAGVSAERVLAAARRELEREEPGKRATLGELADYCDNPAGAGIPSECRARSKEAAAVLRRVEEFRKRVLTTENEGYYCNVCCHKFLRSLP